MKAVGEGTGPRIGIGRLDRTSHIDPTVQQLVGPRSLYYACVCTHVSVQLAVWHIGPRRHHGPGTVA
jgi:hypothetical protein